MKIIVAGDGEVGFHLAKLLTDELHDITVVDPHSELLKMVESNTDLMTITGDSTSISILDRANVKRADLLISVLHDENVNLMTCIIGKKLGARKTIARINNTEFIDHGNEVLFNSLGIDHLVCPERLAAEEIVDLLDRSAATETFEFSKGKLLLFLIKLDEKALVIGKTLDQIASEFSYLDFRAVAIHRNSRTIIPRGNDQFMINDLTYVVTKPDGIKTLLKLGGKEEFEIKNVMIAGGGRIGLKTSRRLENSHKIKLIEIDREKSVSLSEELDNVLIINGDARDIRVARVLLKQYRYLADGSLNPDFTYRETKLLDDIRVIDMYNDTILNDVPPEERVGHWTDEYFNIKDIEKVIETQFGKMDRIFDIIEKMKTV